MIRKSPFARIALTIVLFAGCAHAAPPPQKSLPPRTQDRPLEDRIRSQERAERDEWQKPDEVVRALRLHNGDVVADIGAGSGYFTRRIAKAVAPEGKVYAVDVAADVLGYLRERAQREGLGNIDPIVSREDDPMLPERSTDLAFFCDTTHHIEGRVQFYRKMSRGLKDHARMAIVDYPPGGPHTPHPPDQLVSREQVIREADEAGFRLSEEFRFLPYQYFLVFEKK